MNTRLLMLCALISGLMTVGAKDTKIYKTDTDVVIDGKLLDSAWQNAVEIPVKYYDKKGGPGVAEKVPMTFKLCWDKNYLYIGYEVFDTDLRAGTEGEAQGPIGNKRRPVVIDFGKVPDVDCTEFFMTWGSNNFFWEIHHNAKNNFSDVWCTVAETGWDINKTKAFKYGINFGHAAWIEDYNEGKFRLKKAVYLKQKKSRTGRLSQYLPNASTVNNSHDVDTGYTAEIRLPIGGLAVPTKAELWEEYTDAEGRKRQRSLGFNLDKLEFRLLAVVQNMTLDRRYHHSSPDRKGGWFHQNAKDWNTFVFTKETAPEK